MTTFDLSDTAAALRRDFDESFSRAPSIDDRSSIDLLMIRASTIRDNDGRYAVRLTDIAVLVKNKTITPVPTQYTSLLGIASFRNAIAPVHDLASLLGITTEQPTWLVLCATKPLVAFAFANFEGHTRVHPSALSMQSSDISTIHSREILRTSDATIPIIDMRAIVKALTH